MLSKSITKKLFTGCCAVLLMATAISAEDSTDARDGHAGGMPPMGPPAEMKQLSGILGSWKADFEMRMAEEAPWTTSPATLVYTSILGGAGYKGEFSTTAMGMPFNGISRITFNRNSGKWQVTWIDDMGAYQSLNEGNYTDGKLVVTGSDTYMGQDFMMRETLTLTSATELDWIMETSYDEGKTWFVNMKSTYTKQ